MKNVVLILALCLPLLAMAGEKGACLYEPENLAVLRCEKPDENFRLAGSNAPSQIFWPDEAVNLKGVFKKGSLSGTVEFGLEIQEISTRDPEAKLKSGYTDTAGYAPKLGLEGKPVSHTFKVTFDDKPDAAVDITNV